MGQHGGCKKIETGRITALGFPRFVFLERFLQSLLAEAGGEVAARAFDDGADNVGGAAQAAGDGVRVINGDEEVVDFVHRFEKALGFGGVIVADDVETAAAHFGGGFPESVEVGGIFHAERVRVGQWLVGDEGENDAGFGKFFERVLSVSGMIEVGVVGEVGANGFDDFAGLGELGAGLAALVAVSGADGVGAEADERARTFEGFIARGVFGGEAFADAGGDLIEVVHDSSTDLPDSTD